MADRADPSQIRLLVAEDEEHLGAILEHFLRGRGYAVTMCRDGKSALAASRLCPFDVALIDIVMPEMDGLEVLRHLQAEHAPPEVITITGNGTIDTAITAIKLGAYDYISKPYRMAEIDVMVRRAWEKRELGKANAMLRRRTPADTVFAASANPVMQNVLDQLPSLARGSTPVILHAERGAGKSYLARYIHAISGRPHDALIELRANSGRTVALGSLVGHEGTAPDGTEIAPGAFLLGDRGTVVIDLEALDRDARPALRRALEEGDFARIGGNARIPLTARVVICSETSTDARAFTNMLPGTRLVIPPLRDRAEDLELIATQLLEEQGSPTRRLGPDAVDVLTSYSWPGNVRELAAVLCRASILAQRPAISGADIRILVAAASVGAEGGGSALADLEKLHIEAMLVRCNWHQGRAAEALGISTKTLYRKMREFGFRRPRKRKLARARPEA